MSTTASSPWRTAEFVRTTPIVAVLVPSRLFGPMLRRFCGETSP
jgi:hypothetical protein